MECLFFLPTCYRSATQQSEVIKLRLTGKYLTVMFGLTLECLCVVHRGTKLPDRFAKYFAILKTNTGWMDHTGRKWGKDPEWKKEFLW